MKQLTILLAVAIAASTMPGCSSDPPASVNEQAETNPETSAVTVSPDSSVGSTADEKNEPETIDLQARAAEFRTELAAIARPKLTVQPEYATTPLFCLIAVGPERQKQFSVALDGNRLYVDKNANGDLTDDGEAFDVRPGQNFGGTDYSSASVSSLVDGEYVYDNVVFNFARRADGVTTAGISMVLADGQMNSTNDAHLLPMPMSADFSLAPVVQFDGRLTLGQYQDSIPLVIGEESDFYTFVGTQGVGYGTFTAIENVDIPENASPEIEIEFAAADGSSEPLTIRSRAEVRC